MSVFTQPGETGYHDEAVYSQADMDRAFAITQQLRRRLEHETRQIRYTLAAVVLAAGGEVRVPLRVMRAVGADTELSAHDSALDDSVIFTVTTPTHPVEEEG